jgi:hypothetical protein
MCLMQVVPCTKEAHHDWSECPYAHPGEKANRRDPRTSKYTGIICPDMKKVSLDSTFYCAVTDSDALAT